MNINSTELLLLNKKIKFAGEDGKQAQEVAVPTPETNTPQTGMNMLMFQGLNNVVSNPQLSGELKIMREDSPKASNEGAAENSAKEYVAPYQTNLAFQGKASKVKSVALAALMGLATLGATSTLTSCDDKEYIGIPGSSEVNVTVNVDLSAMTSLFEQMQIMWQQMLEQQQITNEQLQQNNEFMKQLLEMYKQGMTDANAFYEQMYNFIMSSTTNQEIIIDLLTQNGMSQDEANDLLRELVAEVKAGNITAAEAMEKIMDLLGDIKGILSQVLTSLQKAEEDRAELIEIANEIKESSKVTNEQLETLIAQNDSLIKSNKDVIEKLKDIRTQIEQANLDSNANFEKVIETLNMSKTELINVLLRLGYTQIQIENMNAAQIIEAIKENTEITKENNVRLEEINNAVKDGTISAKEAADKILELLEEINNNILALTESFNNFVSSYQSDKKEAYKLLSQLVKNGYVQTSILAKLQATIANMDANITGIKVNTDVLLEIAQDDTKFKELIATIKEVAAGGSGNIDYEKFEEMFEALGIKITDAINMSQSELVAAIKEFQKIYVDVEQKQTEELQSIQLKIQDLQIFIAQGGNNKEIINAIKDLTDAVSNGNTDITEELKALQDQLDKLQASIDAIYSAIASQASKVDTYFKKWDAKFDGILGSLKNIESQLATIIANQKTAEVYLNSMLNAIESLKEEIKNLEEAAGGNIDYDKLEEMWKQHDEANFNKYSQLIKDLGIDTSKLDSIEELLKSIDAKMDYIKENSEILNQILDKLSGIDWSNPDYSSKLDRIIEILENFKCNCDCGGNNEGILGDLDDVLG